ncbi:MAG: prolipoprotein diacylglyceryl transferase family protein, partial [Pseudomonadota bacterium]
MRRHEIPAQTLVPTRNKTGFMIPYPEIDPVIFSIGPLSLRWYSLAYIGGLAAGWWYLARLLKKPALWPASG